MNQHKAYYRGAGLSFDHATGTVTDFDTGQTTTLTNLFSEAAGIREEYFARWVSKALFPTMH